MYTGSGFYVSSHYVLTLLSQCNYFWEFTPFEDWLLSGFHYFENLYCEIVGDDANQFFHGLLPFGMYYAHGISLHDPVQAQV